MKISTPFLLLLSVLLLAACSKTKETTDDSAKEGTGDFTVVERPDLPEYCQVSGIVTDDRGIGIQEAGVELVHVGGDGQPVEGLPPYQALTARGGGYSFKFPCGKSPKVALRSSFGRNLYAPSQVVSLVSGKMKHDIKLEIRKEDLPCEFNNAEAMPACHICAKKDMVIPYRYGLPSVEMGQREKAGEIRLGGCVIDQCQPSWYCKRDEVDVLLK